MDCGWRGAHSCAASASQMGHFKRWLSVDENLLALADLSGHGRYIVFQITDDAVFRNLFVDIQRLIAELRPFRTSHQRREVFDCHEFEPNPPEDCVQIQGKRRHAASDTFLLAKGC